MSERVVLRVCCGLCVLVGLASAQRQATLGTDAPTVVYVDAAAPAGGNGLSWGTAFQDLQDGLALAASNPSLRRVWIAEGTYTPAPPGGPRDATFLLTDGVELYGGFAGDETALEQHDPVLHPTILSGDLLGDDQPGFVNYDDNSYGVVTVLAASVVVDGLTIRGGNADRLGTPAGQFGAGLRAVGADLDLVDVVLTENTGTPAEGTALHASGGGVVTLERVRVEGNRDPFIGFVVRLLDNQACFLRGLVVRQNEERGIGLYRNGLVVVEDSFFELQDYGLYLQDNGPCTVEDSTFERNGSPLFGGGLEGRENRSLLVRDCTFRDNPGSAVRTVLEDAVLDGILVTGNRGAVGALDLYQSSVELRRSTLSRNLRTSAIYLDGGDLILEDSLLEGMETGSALIAVGASATVRRTVFQDNDGGFSGLGAGIQSTESIVRIEDSMLLRNSARHGTAITVLGTAGRVDVVRCRLEGNAVSAGAPGPTACGIAVFTLGVGQSVRVRVQDTLFLNNEIAHLQTFNGARAEAVNCTFVSTGAMAGPLVAADTSFGASEVVLQSCIVRGIDDNSLGGAVQTSYSNVRGGAPGTGNLDVDPLFVAPGDPRLSPSSPCIDAGDPARVASSLDLEGDPRFLDGDLDGVLRVDMGHDEYDPVHLEVTPRGDRFVVDLTGPVGQASLALGTNLSPTFLTGLGFLSVDPLVLLPWPGPPSSMNLSLPMGVLPPVHFQAVLMLPPGSVGRGAISNLVTVELPVAPTAPSTRAGVGTRAR